MRFPDWLRRRKQVEAEIQSEVAGHLAARADELTRRGMPAAEARRRARLEFGSPDKYTEQAREAAGVHALAALGQDLRFGLRLLRKSPGFTLTAVLLLALGIGANAAIFSMVDWLLLRPLPFAQPGRLAYLVDTMSGRTSNGFTYPNYLDIQAQTRAVFSGMAGVEPFQMDGIAAGGTTDVIWTNYTAGDLFGVLGVHPAIGRFFRPPRGDDAKTPAEMVLSYAYWQARYGGRTDVLGSTARVNGRPFTIVGVAPRGFHGAIEALSPQAFLPIRFSAGEMGASQDPLRTRGGNGLGMILVGRRRPGLSLSEVQPALAVVGRRMAAAYPKQDPWRGLRAIQLSAEPPGAAAARGSDPLRTVATLFLALAAMVLLLACVNIANLLLARAGVRAREMAVRAALGAGRARLLRQMLTESLLLALLGGAGGLLVATLACQALNAIPLGGALPIALRFAANWRVWLYALALAALTGVVTGIIPAWQASRLAPDAVLRAGGRGLTGGRTRLRSGLVVAEIGGALALLIVAGLFTRSLTAARHADLGFQPGCVVNLSFDPHAAGYGPRRGEAFAARLLRRVRALPGVASASVAATVPLGNVSYGARLRVPGVAAAPRQAPSADYNAVTPGYFRTMGLRLLRGRGIRAGDTATAPRVAVINATMAQRFWPGRKALGRTFYRDDDPAALPIRVVGVVADSVTGNMGEAPHAYFYLPYAQRYIFPATLQMKLAGADEATVLAAARRDVRRIEPAATVFDQQPMTAALRSVNGLFLFQLGAGLAGAMGLLGLGMAIIGVYGVIAYAASQRTQEIGVRVALGASRASILRMVLRQGLAITGAGLALGLGLAALLAGALGSLLLGVRPHDPVTYATATLLLATVALLASLVPARRAMRQDPVAALRCE